MAAKSANIFVTGIALSCITSLCLLTLSAMLGRHEFFLLLNNDLGVLADQFFRYWTILGDGITWVAVAILVVIFRRQYLLLIVCAIIVSTLITQFAKHFIFPHEFRPTYGLIDMKLIHTVTGVELYTANSFPSGHTATAFTLFLLACLLVKKWWVVPVGFVCAVLVGYSRIYLAQHFPMDVGAGILVAIITVILSAQIQKRWAPLPQ